MDAVTLGILLPHELFHSFYSYEQGEYFYQFFPGLPGVSWRLKIYSLTTQDLQAFWDNNAELKAELQEEFGEARKVQLGLCILGRGLLQESPLPPLWRWGRSPRQRLYSSYKF